jgi:argininosuccinate lyase
MAKTKKKQALTPKWSGRFAQGIDPRALAYTQSISFDRRLYRYDIVGSLVHAKMLHGVGLLGAEDYKKISRGLNAVLQDIEAGRFIFREEDEDIHLNIEKALIARIGPAGGRLHTARSRNDQVALDVRLFCRDHLRRLHAGLVDLEKVFLKKAREFLGVVMPGYTHLQRAQPVLFSHHLMAYVEMFERDRGRLEDAYKRLNVMPLGSGALAGTTFPLDREFVARELGFDGVTRNSLDAVGDRDFAVEIAAAGALLMTHLSRLSEELILWSSSEFDFVKLPEPFCTGSSMMPQKMNPDVPELVRGKTGRVTGHLMGLLTLLKGLPLAYNKDLQEDKEAVFDLFDTLISTVRIVAALIAGTRPNAARTEKAASDGFLLATDLADWLVRHGVDFRSSHEVTARIVRHALEKGKDLKDLTLGDLKKFSGKFTPEVFRALDVKSAVNHRRVTGGTARANVAREIRRVELRLKNASL